jgi:hypothetical protein
MGPSPFLRFYGNLLFMETPGLAWSLRLGRPSKQDNFYFIVIIIILTARAWFIFSGRPSFMG